MSKRHKRQPTLEGFLLEIGKQPLGKDGKKRQRLELLAHALWSKALSGDDNAQRLLLARLPVCTPESEGSAHFTDNPDTGAIDTYAQLIAVLKNLVERSILPMETFSIYNTGTIEAEKQVEQ